MAEREIIIVSGGMGDCGDRLVRTALAQFGDADVPLRIVPLVRTLEDVREIVGDASRSEALIIHTLVDSDLRSKLVSEAAERGVAEIDTIGPLLGHLESSLGRDSLGTPGLYRKIHEDYFRRVEAIEFAVGHDDGRNFTDLDRADIVLTGVSRAGKTPLSMYLAMRGYKTANVPLVKDIEPPDEIFQIERGRVVGLTIEPERLVYYRRQRSSQLGQTGSTKYTDPKEILRDLEYARQIFRRGRFLTVDVTNKPIEESANAVVALISRHTGDAPRRANF